MSRLVTLAAVLVLLAVLLLLGINGCGVGWFVDKLAPDAVLEGQGYFEELRQRQADQILQSVDPSADKEDFRTGLKKVIAVIPQQEPLDAQTVGATVECGLSGTCTKVLALKYRYPDRWILFRITLNNESGRYAITDILVKPESVPLGSLSRFSLRAKGWPHYAISLMALFSVVLALYALVVCIRTPIRRRKWLWGIVTILGIGKLGIYWTSGELWYKILHVSVLPGGWGFDPESAFIYASFPVEAIVFLLLRSHLQRTDVMHSG